LLERPVLQRLVLERLVLERLAVPEPQHLTLSASRSALQSQRRTRKTAP